MWANTPGNDVGSDFKKPYDYILDIAISMTLLIINFMYILLSCGMRIAKSAKNKKYCAVLKGYLALHKRSAKMASFHCYATSNSQNAHALHTPGEGVGRHIG